MASKYTALIADMRDVAIQLSDMPESEFASFAKQISDLFPNPINPLNLMSDAKNGDLTAQRTISITTLLYAVSVNFIYQAQTSPPVLITHKQLPLIN
ncbi:hypothetical protein [Vitreoscilla stercoraria]|uniref:Uncharacterized protein n=1 Tax=Vitreoscilla stercoraria TaxID=61 RepID=A0ABY4EC80_VITST|nr:hypothetical protein [Vitreoscilla stercoraria]UOO93353.1 hypothetical protein LVJ81_04820 [Vitreoscilla stercoraria]